MGINPIIIGEIIMSKSEYVIPSGKYKGLKTRAKSLEDAQRNLRAKIKRIESKLTRQEEAIIQLALNWYTEYDFDEAQFSLVAKGLIYPQERKIKFKNIVINNNQYLFQNYLLHDTHELL